MALTLKVVIEKARKVLSHDSGPFWQFVKYGVIGVMSTAVQLTVFYVLAATSMKCLGSDDVAVKYLGLPSAEFSGDEPWYATRGAIASAATGVGFIIANVFCWLMNRKFVFKPGKFVWYTELAMFFGASTFATVMALAVMIVLIDQFALMTSLAGVIEVAVSFLVNFAIRKFFIFKR
jgi:putative flippase GtrA